MARARASREPMPRDRRARAGTSMRLLARASSLLTASQILAFAMFMVERISSSSFSLASSSGLLSCRSLTHSAGDGFGALPGTAPGHYEQQAWQARRLECRGKGSALPTIRRQNRAVVCFCRDPRGLAFRLMPSAPLRNTLIRNEQSKTKFTECQSPGERIRAFFGAVSTRADAIFAVSVVCSADTAEPIS
jgi:hypothetical protein